MTSLVWLPRNTFTKTVPLVSREFIPEIRDYLQLYLDLMAFLLRLAGWLDLLGLKNSPQFIGECGYNQALINLLHKIRLCLSREEFKLGESMF